MDKINLKEAIKFLKEEILDIAKEIKTNNNEFKAAQRLVATLFFQNKYNPYHWYWKNKNTNKRSFSFCLSSDDIPEQGHKESPEDYKKRYDLWQEYLKTSPYDYLPMYTWGLKEEEKETITCLHVLYNRLRNNKKHTKDDSKYETNSIYKDMLQRLEMHFPIQSENSDISGSERICGELGTDSV